MDRQRSVLFFGAYIRGGRNGIEILSQQTNRQDIVHFREIALNFLNTFDTSIDYFTNYKGEKK